jgi:DNA adenine methylase
MKIENKDLEIIRTFLTRSDFDRLGTKFNRNTVNSVLYGNRWNYAIFREAVRLAKQNQRLNIEMLSNIEKKHIDNNQQIEFGFYNDTGVLRRLGNKNKLAPLIIANFPSDIKCLISLFFGTGAVELRLINKLSYLFANDLDNEVFNLYIVLQNHPDKLYAELERMPIHETLFDYWNSNRPDDPVLRAVAFIFKSNFSYVGKGQTLRRGFFNDKEITLKNIWTNYYLIKNVNFLNCDFRQVLSNTSFKDNNKANSFIYADPPYLNTDNNYETPDWTAKDAKDLFNYCTSSGIRFAISEFSHPYILELAKEYRLQVIPIVDRQNLKSTEKANEILITNFQTKNLFN